MPNKNQKMKTITLSAAAILCCLFTAVNSVTAQSLNFTANTYPVGSGPVVTVVDVNGDRRLDLITANGNNTNTLTVLTNNGSGGFDFYSTLPVGKNPAGVVAADVNGDGHLDLISINIGNNSVTVLTNNGSGVFGSNSTFNVISSSGDVLAADVNGDGYLDLISPSYISAGILTIYTNNGSGVFSSYATLNVGSYPVCACAADVNRDGYVDLITANLKGSNANSLTILTNNGSGVFGFNARITVGTAPDWVVAADVNGDGHVDLITANNAINTLTVLTNNGTGVLGSNATLTVAGIPNWVTAADLNGDGKLDLISANGGTYGTVPGNGNSLTIYTNNGSGRFGSNTTFTVGVGAINDLAADLNADGKLDLVVANYDDNTVTVLMNNSIFPPPTSSPTLTIKQQGGNMLVSWPSVSPGWSLQEKPNLTDPNWLSSGYDGYPTANVGATYPIADDGTNKSLIFPSAAGNLFLRLLHP